MTAADDADEMALRCCVCGTSAEDDSNYLNTKMKMLISKCGHRFCDHCVKREFQHKREVACAACQKPVKKSQLQDKTIEELNFAKETSVRKKVTKDYNKTEEDFDTLDEYNDYLEMLENLIFDLVYGNEDERAAAQKQWKQYRQENAISIATNDAKKADEERRIAQLIAEQQRLAEERRQLQQREDSQFEADIERQKAQLMEVALGERDESDVSTLRVTTTAIPIDQAVTAEMEAAMMGFQPGAMGGAQPVPVPGGKRGPNFGVSESKKLRREQQLAGGYDPDLHFKRNRTEAWWNTGRSSVLGERVRMTKIRDEEQDNKEALSYYQRAGTSRRKGSVGTYNVQSHLHFERNRNKMSPLHDVDSEWNVNVRQ